MISMMKDKPICWFKNNNLIVPKINKQYILKKDLPISKNTGECNYPSGMICKVVKYHEDICLTLEIDFKSISHEEFPVLHRNIDGNEITFKLENASLIGKQYRVSQFYDYFEEFDKDMTMADVLDVRQAMDKLYSAVRGFENSINGMNGDCNSLIVDNYPFQESYDDWVLSFNEWYNSVDDNCYTYRQAIKSLSDDWKDYDNRGKMSGDNPTGKLDNV